MTDTKPTETAAKPQRDAQGRFLPGNDGGAGNPFGRHLARARVQWNSKATPEHVDNVYNVVYEKALEGCAWAIKLYLQYLLGKPNQMVNPDLVDLEEWELYAKATNMQKASPDVMSSPDHRFGLEVARTARPAMAEEARKEMIVGLKEMEEREREMEREEDEYERRAARRKANRAKRKAAGNERAGAKREAKRETQEPARTDSRLSPLASRPPLMDGFFPEVGPDSPEMDLSRPSNNGKLLKSADDRPLGFAGQHLRHKRVFPPLT